jgi:hypothetical protein
MELERAVENMKAVVTGYLDARGRRAGDIQMRAAVIESWQTVLAALPKPEPPPDKPDPDEMPE